jgi:hypothetical protein
MSSGTIAGIVIMVLLAVAATVGFFVLWRYREEQVPQPGTDAMIFKIFSAKHFGENIGAFCSHYC